MANISVTYTFTNATVADATEVNTNFNDIITGLSDSTKDISIQNITAVGVATFNGNVILGNAASDTISATGRLITNLVPLADNLRDLGTTALAFRSAYAYDFFASLGATGTPSHSFIGDTDTGMWSSGANIVNFSAGGTEILELDTTSGDLTVPMRTSDGSAAAPSYSFTSDTDTGIYRVGTNQLGFSTNGTFRAVIDGSGNTGFGTSSPSEQMHLEKSGGGTLRIGETSARYADIVGSSDGAGSGAAMILKTTNSSGTLVDRVVIAPDNEVNPATDNSLILGSSSLRWSDVYAVSGSVNTSDKRLKKNIVPIGAVLNKVLSLKPSEWDSKYKDYEVGKMGFVAQDLEKVFPVLVKTSKEKIKGIKDAKMIMVSGQEMAAILVKTIQEIYDILVENNLTLPQAA